jgi:predicted exporter
MTSVLSVPKTKGRRASGRPLSLWYLALLIIVLVFSCRFLARGPEFEGNILSLLPEIYRDPVVEAALRKQAQTVASKVIVLVRSARARDAQSAALTVAARMRESGLFEQIEERASSERYTAIKELFLRHPFQLASPPESLGELLDEARQQAFSPEGVMWLQNAERDPLLLLPGYFQASLGMGSRFSLRNGFVHVSEPKAENVLIFASLPKDIAFGPSDASVSTLFRNLPRFESATVHPAGLVFFAEESATRTKREVTVITFVTLTLLIGLLLVVFRSLRPVLLTAVCIATSFVIAIYVGDVSWKSLTGNSLHLITIGFGSSLLGVAIDYALHYQVALRTWSPDSRGSPLSRMRSGLILGFLTTVVGFVSIGLSPFPGLRQLALFCVIGLSLALVFVLLLLPLLSGKPVYDSRLVHLAEKAAVLGSRAALAAVSAFVVVLCVVGLPRLRVVDDIRALHTPSERLVRNQREAARLAGFSEGDTVVVVQASSEEQLLEREESLQPLFADLMARGELQGYRAVSRVVPSQSLQQQRYGAFAQLLRSNPEVVRQATEELHLPAKALNSLATLSTSQPPPPLTISQCMGSTACDSVRDLWIGPNEDKVVSIVALSGFTSRNYTELFNREGVTAINQADSISSALKLYRTTAMIFTGYFYLLVFALLIVRYGLSGSLRVFVPSIAGALASLGALGLVGIQINVFSVFAMIVLLGVSIDYSIFFAEDREHHAATGFAVLLSALTTALSFGLLSFSSTPALQSFGIILSIGCLVAAIVARALPASRHRPRWSTTSRCSVLLLVVMCGCSLHLPSPKVRSGQLSPEIDPRALCTYQGIQVEIADDSTPENLASLECSEESLLIVVFNAFGMRVRTISVTSEGSFRDELSYLASSRDSAEAVVGRLQESLHAKND